MSSIETPPIRIGLDALNIQDSHHLRNALINCEDPLKAISDFQEENSISLPSLKPALNLLDLHNVKRLDFHVSIADELKDHLVKKVEELSASINSVNKDQSPTYEDDVKKLEDLLDKSFPLIL
jgi:negative elongation factor B